MIKYINGKNILIHIKAFLSNIPETIKESFIWLTASYLIPIINILIIWGIENTNFKLTLTIINIVYVTNASFLTAVFFVVSSSEQKRKLLNLFLLITYVATITFFVVSVIQLQTNNGIFKLIVFKNGMYVTLILSILFGLVSKYNETSAISRMKAKEALKKNETKIGDKSIKI